MNDPIHKHFTDTVMDYDTVADSVVMKNAELHGVLVASLEFDNAKPLNILDLGCGTGHGMSLMLEKFKNARVIGVDFSNRMIQKSALLLAKYGDRFELIEHDFTDMELGGPYDAVVSAVAIHNATHDEKYDLFRRVFNSLTPGGTFINGDFVEGENEFLDRETKELYVSYVQSHLSGEELKVWLKHINVDDKPMKLSEQFGYLNTLGFESLNLRWLYSNEAVYSAIKPAFLAL